jgi:outer membrane protein assembly factor BamB
MQHYSPNQHQFSPAAAPDALWPTFRRDPRNTAVCPLPADYKNDQPWTFQTGKGIFSSPVIDGNGNIYIGSADHYFYSLDHSGKLRWKFKTGEIIDSAGALPAHQPTGVATILFPSADGHIYCLEKDSGKLIWTFDGNEALEDQFNNWFEGNIALAPDGTLYAGNTNFRYYALSPEGELKWTYKTGSNAWSIAGINQDGDLVWGSCDTFIHGVSREGQVRWKKRTLGFISASAAIDREDKAYIGSFDGNIYALDSRTGKVRWKFKTNDHIYGSAALLEADDADFRLFVGSTDGYLYAINQDGEEVWRYYSGAPIRSSPVVGRMPSGQDGWIIYFGNGAGKLFALQARDGSRRWSYDTTLQTPELADRNDLNGSPALTLGGIVIGGEHGLITYLPYDYPLHHPDPRSSTNPREDLAGSSTFLHYVSPGGAVQVDPPAEVPCSGILTFKLEIPERALKGRFQLNNPPFNQGLRRLEIDFQPPVPHRIEISADGQYLHIIPDGFLPAGETLSLSISGEYFQPNLRIGNLQLGGRPRGKFSETFQFQIRELITGPISINQNPIDVPRLEFTRLSVPIPTMLPSLNQIGFDYMSWVIGVIRSEPKDKGRSGKILCWAVGAKRDQNNQLVIDPESDFILPLSGVYRNNALLLKNQNFQLKVTGIPIPFEEFQIRAELNREGSSLPGVSMLARTRVLSIPNFGPAMIIAGLANQIWKNLVAVGTSLIRPAPSQLQNSPDADRITVADLSYQPPSRFKAGSVTAVLRQIGDSCPAGQHRAGILLTDQSGFQPVAMDYHQGLSSTADSEGNLTSVRLEIPGGTELPDLIQIHILLDTTVLYQKTIQSNKGTTS